MTDFSSAELDGIFYHKFTVCSLDHTGIAFLASHGSIKRSLFYKNSSLLSLYQRRGKLAFSRQNSNLRFKSQMLIAYKFCCHRRIDLIINRSVRTHVVGYFAGSTSLDSLLFHCRLEAILVDSVSLFFQNLFCQIKRESVSIIKLECIFAGKLSGSCCLHLLFHISKDAKSLVDGFVKLVFFICQYLEDKFFFILKLRITVFGTGNHLCA